jgi:hypothetical protein
MRGIFWNRNGFKDPKKHKFISDLTKENNLNFIAISETGRSDFSPRFLKNLCAGRDYLWHSKAPRGRYGGMLLGVDLQAFDIGAIDEGNFYIKFLLCNKAHDFKWTLVVVYDPSQDELKEFFLAELVNMCTHERFRWPFLFNAVIDGLNLKEIQLSRRKYTWANNLANPTFKKLDRVLVTTEWKEKYPLTKVQALTRGVSDRTPLLLNSVESSLMATQPMFKFELG